jgi:hypothetical protein
MASILKVDQLQKPDGSTPTAADLGIDVAGSVVQVYRHVFTTKTTNQADYTFAEAAGSSFSFTPKFSNSQLIIQAEAMYYLYQNNNYIGGAIRIVHDGTALSNSSLDNYAYVLQGTPMWDYNTTNKSWSVSAGSTNARQISLQFAPYGGTDMDINNFSESSSSITVYEIAQ